MLKFSLTPFDVLYFGSGKPFNFNVQEASSIFPPLPNTLASSVCSKLYHEKKINVENVLKKFYGPFLEKDGKILFPKPLDILSEKKKHGGDISGVNLIEKFNLLNPTYTDCKDLKGLLWQNKKSKEFEVFESFITLEGLKKWLNNQEFAKEDIISKGEIFDFEPRIGIQMNYSKNVTREEDALYRIEFIRLKEGVKMIFFAEFDYENSEFKRCELSDEEKILDFFANGIKVLKLGGEMKSVNYECERTGIEEFGFIQPKVENEDIIKILYLTPGFLEKEDFYEILTGSIRTTNLGMCTKKFGVKIKKGVKEGSVIYVKVKDKENLKNIWLNPRNGEFIGTNLRIYAK